MATIKINGVTAATEPYLFFSSCPPSVQIEADGDVRVRIWRQEDVDSAGAEPLYSELLTPVGGVAELYDPASLLTFLLQLEGVAYACLVLEAGEGDDARRVTLRVIYAEHTPEVADVTGVRAWLNGHYLTCSDYKRIGRKGSDRLTALIADGESTTARIKVYGEGTVAKLESAAQQVGSSGALVAVNIDMQEIAATEGCPRPDMLQVTLGGRNYVYYVDDAIREELYVVRNSYGCVESIGLDGSVKETIVHESTMANVGGHRQPYDVSLEAEVEVASGALAIEEARAIARLMGATEMYVQRPGATMRPIAIKELKAEISDADGSAPNITFKYKFCDRRRLELGMETAGRIFTAHYTLVFG